MKLFLFAFLLTSCVASLSLASLMETVMSDEDFALPGNPSLLVKKGKQLCTGEGVLKDELEGLAYFEVAKKIMQPTRKESAELEELTALYSKGFTPELREQVASRAEALLNDTYYLGSSFERPEATLYAGYLHLTAPDDENRILGLAILYAGSHWFSAFAPSDVTFAPKYPTIELIDPPNEMVIGNAQKMWIIDPDYSVDFSELIAKTENSLGKTASVKSQSIAKRILKHLNRHDHVARQFAIQKALNLEQGELKERAHREEMEKTVKQLLDGVFSNGANK